MITNRTPRDIIQQARELDIVLTPTDIVWDDEYEGWTIDGMDPDEWLTAMTSEG